jgi:hypothetical protein
VSYLIDTNVISEVRKGAKCDPNVAAWYGSIADAELHLSVLVLGEIRRGIERVRPSDERRADNLAGWLDAVELAFGERILPIDRAVADEWGRMNARRPVSTVDALLAATAKVHGLTLVTRNVADVANLDAEILNPFVLRP